MVNSKDFLIFVFFFTDLNSEIRFEEGKAKKRKEDVNDDHLISSGDDDDDEDCKGSRTTWL